MIGTVRFKKSWKYGTLPFFNNWPDYYFFSNSQQQKYNVIFKLTFIKAVHVYNLQKSNALRFKTKKLTS